MEGSGTPVQVGEQLLGKYVIERVLGQGGMGVVVQASHIALGSKVAIKFLLPEACHHPGAVERFLREARAAVQIQSEHVARVSDVGTLDTGLPYMVMEFLDGNDLSEEIQSRGTLPVEEAVGHLLEALEAIAEAHALGIVHRDLKPANLFLAKKKDGTRAIKVLDFGISKAVQPGEANLTQTSSMMGSPLYMAPEQIRNAKGVDARADVWSLGVILHECLSGQPPFGGDTLSGVLAAIVADAPAPLEEIRPDLSPLLTSAVARCLEKDPARRVQHVAEFAQLLSTFAPVQAQRSLPRIAAVLGKTLPQGTDQQAVALDATAAFGPSQASSTVGSTATAGSMAVSNTAQTWANTDNGTAGFPRRSPLSLIGGAIGLIVITAAVVWFVVAKEPTPVEETSSAASPTEESSVEATPSTAAVPNTPTPPPVPAASAPVAPTAPAETPEDAPLVEAPKKQPVKVAAPRPALKATATPKPSPTQAPKPAPTPASQPASAPKPAPASVEDPLAGRR